MKLNKKTIHNLRDRVITSSKQSTFYAIFSELRHNRKYLLATLITLAFAGYYFFNTVDNSSGIIDKRNALDTTNTSSINNSAITNNSNGSGITVGNNDEDKLDTSKYKGTYSVSVNLDSPIVLDEDRTINSYNLVYKIENDNVISKYIVIPDIFSYKLFSGVLEYKVSGTTKYITANDMNYKFVDNSIVEENGKTYALDKTISPSDNKVYVDDTKIYLTSNNGLILLKNNNIFLINDTSSYTLPDEYKNNGGELLDRFYEYGDLQFKFIVFRNGESKNCYDEIVSDTASEEILYQIYMIKYNAETRSFDNPELLQTRYKNTNCDTYKSDIKNLSDGK